MSRNNDTCLKWIQLEGKADTSSGNAWWCKSYANACMCLSMIHFVGLVLNQHDIKQPEEKMISSDVHGFPYSANNVIVDNAIVLYISCNTGDRSSNMLDRSCIRKLGFFFFFYRAWLFGFFCFVTFFREYRDIF